MPAHTYRLDQAVSENRLLVTTVVLSFIGHMLFFVILIYGPSQFASKRYIPTIVNVSLVSLPAPGPPGASGGTTVAKEEPKAQKAVQVKKKPTAAAKTTTKTTTKKMVSTAPEKWKAKTSLKQKTFKSEKVVKSAIEEIAKKAEETEPDPVAAALDRLREKVDSEEASRAADRAEKEKSKAAEAVGSSDGGTETGGGAGRSGLSGILTSAILVYQQEISYHIRNNWVFSEELAGQRKDLEARLMIKVLANGEIRDIWFEKRSGNRYLDESAYKAVMKSNPLPPLPQGYQLYNVGLIFTPSGLQ